MAPKTYNFDASQLYDRYLCTIKMRNRIMGGTPKNPDLIAQWVKARTKYDDELSQAQTEEALETVTTTTEVAEAMWTGFPRDEGGLFVWTRQIKALFKECASLLRVTVKKIGSKQILQHGFEIKSYGDHEKEEQRVHPLEPVMEPHGYDENPIHVDTPKGPRTALRRQDFMEEVSFRFQIWVLRTEAKEKRHLGMNDIARLLTHAQENGLGACRSQGWGKFHVVSFEKLD